MLDYDGTISPFRQDPEQAFMYRGFSSLLQQIVRTGKTRLVIISRRDASEVVPLLEIEPHPASTGRIVKEKGELVLKDPVTKVSYKLDDPAKAKQYVGKQVKVTGKLDMNGNTIQMDSIEPLS